MADWAAAALTSGARRKMTLAGNARSPMATRSASSGTTSHAASGSMPGKLSRISTMRIVVSRAATTTSISSPARMGRAPPVAAALDRTAGIGSSASGACVMARGSLGSAGVPAVTEA